MTWVLGRAQLCLEHWEAVGALEKKGVKLFIEALELCKNGMISVTVISLPLQLLSTNVVLGAPFPC